MIKLSSLKNVIKPRKFNTVLVIFGLIIIACAVLYLLNVTNIINIPAPNTQAFIESFSNNTSVNSQDDLEPRNNEIIIALFYADWCGYCKRFKPTYLEMISNQNQINKNRKENGKGPISLKMIDCDTETGKVLSREHGIQGFPTLKVFPSSLDDGSMSTQSFNNEILENL